MRSRFLIIYLSLLLAGAAIIYFFPAPGAIANPPSPGVSPEERTANHFNSIRNQPGELLAFLRQMPKGGDLHSHLSGAVYAETLIDLAALLGRCIDKQTLTASEKCGANGQMAATLAQDDMSREDIPLYRRLVDAWSMRNWQESGRSGHDQFFDTFGKFGKATYRTGDMLAEVMERAADGNVSYLELMLTPDNGVAKDFAKQLVWTGEFGGMRKQLLDAGLHDKAQAAVRATIDDAETSARAALKCGTSAAQPGCAVTVRYLFQVARAGAKREVFAQMVTAFEVAGADRRMLGLNLVEPEDYPVPRRDFTLHMQMLNFLHPLYPNAHITLHAGELTLGLVPLPTCVIT